MKKLTITIQAELEIPDSWELVEHTTGVFVLKVGDQFVDFDITPLCTASEEPDATWSDEDEEFTWSLGLIRGWKSPTCSSLPVTTQNQAAVQLSVIFEHPLRISSGALKRTD